MTVKGMTRKQLITLLERDIRDDRTCITEGDMCLLFDMVGDIYDAECKRGEILFTLEKPNVYWKEWRPFLPQKNDVLKGLKDYELEETD